MGSLIYIGFLVILFTLLWRYLKKVIGKINERQKIVLDIGSVDTFYIFPDI